MIKSVSPLTYSLGSVYLVNTFMIECTCYLNLTSFSTDLAKYTNKTFTRFDYMSDTAVFSITIRPKLTIFGPH